MSLDLQAEFEKRKPWITEFFVNGNAYGGEVSLTTDARLDQFLRAFPDAQTILEMGSLEGGHTFGLAQRASVKRVVGLEGRPANIEKARFVQNLLGIQNVEFALTNLESTDLSAFGKFDAVFCSGVLYHLPEPWKLIHQMAQVSPHLFLWTHYVPADQATETLQGYRGAKRDEHGLADPLSGLSVDSFWPSLDSLLQMLRDHGYGSFCVFEDNPGHVDGASITMAATSQALDLRTRLAWGTIHWPWLARWWRERTKRTLKAKLRRFRSQ